MQCQQPTENQNNTKTGI